MAESYRDEIAKLESMYLANPEGRVFTHLAEAYRKAGDLVRAREVLEDGLRRHSDSASGYVVLGRLMQDLAQPQEASSAFARVLELDPENRVALRALGELARAAGDYDQAMAHFRQLQVLDPSDESVGVLISELKNAPPPPPRPAAAQAAAETAAAEAPPGEVPAAEAPAAEVRAAAPEMAATAEAAEAAPAEAPEPASVAPVAAAGASPAHLGTPGAADGELTHGTFTPPGPSLEAPRPEGFARPEHDLDAAAWPGAGEEEMALPVLEGLDAPGLAADELEAAGEIPPLPYLDQGGPELPEEAQLEAAGLVGPADGLPTFEAPPEWEGTAPAEVVTETMAELYRAQGHIDRAAEVYRALLKEHPGDEVLERKLLQLELSILSPAARGEGAPTAAGPGVAEAAAPGEPPAQAPGAELSPAEASRAQALAELAAAELSPAEEAQAQALAELGALELTPAEAAPAEPAPFAAPGPETPSEAFAAVEPEPEKEPEPWLEAAAEAPAEPAAAMEAVWGNGGEVTSGEPTPYAWAGGGAGAEEEAGPPISAYLRGLVAWRRSTADGADGSPAYAPEAPGAAAAEYAPEPSAWAPATGYAPAGTGYSAEPATHSPEPARYAAEATPGGGAAASPPAADEAPAWTESPAPPAGAASPEPWGTAAPTWAEEAAQEPWSGTAPAGEAAPAPAGDLDWLTGPGGVAPESPPPVAMPTDEAGEGEAPGDDDDLEMFRAWLQSLKK